MPHRIADLRRQRALIAEHLAWLDREIAEVEKNAAPPDRSATTANAAAQGAVSNVDTADTPNAAVGPEASKILAELDATNAPKPEDALIAIDPALRSEHRPADIKDDVRRGCFLYAAIATLLVVGGGALLIWVAREYNKKHPPKPKVEQVEEYRP